ncbi:adenine/guanine permease AZG2 [Phalaenopsis equestris]|uniref:adenine/guanine permease AZG2 n=1 Tax=Phalaenopsis equestris TaxID=78828 RepID=UPI0009E3FFA3|nr:adenine/guanine permease AZG2 [Phalaenopsis equestris]
MGKGTCSRVAEAWQRLEGGLNCTVSKSRLGCHFKLDARKTTFTKELRSGLATFLTMAYIISVNSSILVDSGGPCTVHDCTTDQLAHPGFHPDCRLRPNPGYDRCLAETKGDLVVATAAAAAIGSLVMGVVANLPFALATGMGANAFFTYNMVGFHGTGPLTYGEALAAVMLEGAVFLAISALGLRGRLARLIPRGIRLASAAGIGLFLAFTGLQAGQGVGLVGPSTSTLVTLSAGALERPSFWLGAAGFVLTAFCLARGVKGGIIYGILFVTVVSWFRGTQVTIFPRTPVGDVTYAYFRRMVDLHKIKHTAGMVDFTGLKKRAAWVPLLTLLYVDILDTTGSMYSMAEYAGFTDENGGFEGEYWAFLVDGGSTIVAAALGTTTVTTYIESTAGIKEGGRSGLTAVTTAACFVMAIFFGPVLMSVPSWAVGPALVMVGMMMMKLIKEIEWGEAKEAVPAFLTMILMPLTFSISNGIIAGIGVHIVLHLYEYGEAAARWIWRAREAFGEGRNQVSAAAGEMQQAATVPPV